MNRLYRILFLGTFLFASSEGLASDLPQSSAWQNPGWKDIDPGLPYSPLFPILDPTIDLINDNYGDDVCYYGCDSGTREECEADARAAGSCLPWGPRPGQKCNFVTVLGNNPNAPLNFSFQCVASW